MPKIKFDTDQQKKSDFEKELVEKNFNFQDIRKDTKCAHHEHHMLHRSDSEKHRFEFDSDRRNERNNVLKYRGGPHNSFPIWVACAIFSILGAFAAFTPVCSLHMVLDEYTIQTSFTVTDIFNTAGKGIELLDSIQYGSYFATIIAFSACLAVSILIKEKINDLPYIPLLSGAIALCGMIITFGFDTIVRLIMYQYSICLITQIACSLILILMSIVPLKEIIGHKAASVR